MVRSMWSGVAGMKSHQTRMDTIGNNIANVNTTGFKSSRVTFRDVYYQSLRSASAGSGNRGGVNPSQVGYGSSVGSVDLNMTQSIMNSTGNPLDVAIAGDGFLQVQDSDGNTYYTKAGMLGIDSYGNLIDTNGNFVLGVSGSPVGKAAGDNRIQLQIPSVDPAAATAEEAINGIKYTIKAGKNTTDGNVSFNFTSVTDLPLGQKCEAIITSSGINIRLNAKETFTNLAELQTEVNAAIKRANNNAEHPAGTFTITMDDNTKFNNLTGAEIAGSNFGVKSGTVPVPTALDRHFSVKSTGEAFDGTATPAWTITNTIAADETVTPPVEAEYEISVKVGTKTYSKKLTASEMASPGSALLETNPSTPGDTITINFPSEAALLTLSAGANAAKDGTPETFNGGAPYTTTVNATPAQDSKDLGLGSKPFRLTGGTEGGAQTVNDLSGISIGADGVISGTHAVLGNLELGRIDLATFANSKGLLQSGKTYYAASASSGEAKLAKPGENGSGPLASNNLEMSNVDLSQEFADMITTQRGFQANSRLITVSDTMLEELINLKR